MGKGQHIWFVNRLCYVICDEQLPSAEAGKNTTALRHNVNESKIMEKICKSIKNMKSIQKPEKV